MATKKFLAKKMSRVIYINESTINLIKEAEQEIYFYSFQNAVKDFLMELLTHQTNPTLPEFFNGVISKNELLKNLIDLGIIKEITKLTDDGSKGKMSIKYVIPRKNFRSNISRLYDKIYKNQINETDCGGVMGGGGCFDSSDAIDSAPTASSSDSSSTAKSSQGSGPYVTPLGYNKKKKSNDSIIRRVW
jgi:hypothetical protein